MTKPTLDPKSGFSRLRVDLTYDGTNFSGWAKQPGLRTIQEEFETALSTITRGEVSTIVAGRTDAGVHAKHQVLHVDLPENTEVENLAFRLNQLLKADVRVLAADWAPLNFHARFGPNSRTYQYKIVDGGKVTAPFDRHDSVSWFRPLDIDLMNEASKTLLGEHDFTSFRAAGCQSLSPNRNVQFVKAWREDNLVIFEITANSFLHHSQLKFVRKIFCSLNLLKSRD